MVAFALLPHEDIFDVSGSLFDKIAVFVYLVQE
jgi:hypothetical protein